VAPAVEPNLIPNSERLFKRRDGLNKTQITRSETARVHFTNYVLEKVMTQDEFKVGDTVQLKSGGPIMTIEKIAMYGGERKAACMV
jgi:hypothetical protein